MPNRTDARKLSIVIPCFNEEAVIRETHKRVMEVVDALSNMECEIVYVDDGSRDGTLDILRSLDTGTAAIRVVALSRNFGHQVAISAGLDHAGGDAIVTIDADLQDPPEVIPRMLDRWRDGADIVYGQREQREGEPALRLLGIKMFYRLINWLSNTSIPMDAGDFRLIDRRVLEALQAMPERDRFLRGMVAWTGFRQEFVRYPRASRFAGVTKYPAKKLVQLATDGIVSFSVVPLRLAIWAGVLVATLSTLGIVYTVIVRLTTSDWVQGWAMLEVSLLFLGGIQLIFLGVMGEYLGRIYMEMKQRPLYFVKERRGFNHDDKRAVPDSNPAPGE
jgi:dolichol-phosphate mannosyltransferase